MFNPYYLDYPVVGVSWQNANNYAKWLSDRFNEVTLIKKHVLDYCPFPSDQDYFNTEAYIEGIWKGQIRLKLPSHDYNPIRKKDFNWSDHVFIPAFRLPSRLE
ncbi:MAG: SUMF1/EgtB/PvdO family nonheme iron enzyme, partial [Bacteroidia bacterium]|nr:SUMF1/EgtB/PvdO family nonheme iron enzyme [Bacteroidia bacterium]